MTFADLYAVAELGLLTFIACVLIRIAVAVEQPCKRCAREHKEA